jgi:hypothetical protein
MGRGGLRPSAKTAASLSAFRGRRKVSPGAESGFWVTCFRARSGQSSPASALHHRRQTADLDVKLRLSKMQAVGVWTAVGRLGVETASRLCVGGDQFVSQLPREVSALLLHTCRATTRHRSGPKRSDPCQGSHCSPGESDPSSEWGWFEALGAGANEGGMDE